MTTRAMKLKRRGEAGYTLVALLAVMTIIATLAAAAAPNIKQQAQRSREEEAIFRGEEIAEGIRLFVRATGRLPTSMEELQKGIPRGVKNVQVIRAVAASDPLSSSHEWKLIRITDPQMLDFQRAVISYNGGRPLPPPRDQALLQFYRQLPQMQVTIIGQAAESAGESEQPLGGEDDTPNNSGPFIGVVSRSRHASVITYYGVERHDQWVFTPLFR